MKETFTIEYRCNGIWHEYLSIDDDDIQGLGVTSEIIEREMKRNPNPLSVLFTKGTEFRIIHSIHDEVSRFIVGERIP